MTASEQEPEGGKIIRAFFAIEPDEGARQKLRSKISDLKRILPADAPVRWTNPSNLHLTLRFLGETETGLQLDSVIDEAYLILKDCNAFEYELGAAYLFPNRKRPVVVAAAIDAPPQLSDLAGKLDRVAIRCGHRAEKRDFNPHLTLGRIRRGSRLRLPEFEEIPINNRASVVTLMKSEPSSEGPPVYSPIYRFPLKSD